MASRRPPLRLEELGARLLPSITPLTVPLPPAATALTSVVARVQPHHKHADHSSGHALAGHGHGTYTASAVVPDAGRQYHLAGSADLAGLGHVTVGGDIHGVGFIRNGHAGGTLTFTNSHGSVTVALNGPVQDAFSPLPGKYSYSITGGTGDYAHLTDGGTLALALHANGKFTLSIPASTDA